MSSPRRKAKATLDNQGPAPADGGDLFLAAVAAHQAGRLGEAEGLYRDILVVNPRHAESWSNLGLALLSRDAAEAAVEACETAVALHPTFAAAHLNLVSALQAAGRWPEASSACQRAILLQPERADLRVRLAIFEEASGRLDAARETYRQAAALAPDDAALPFNAGRLAGLLGRPDEAVADFGAALAIDPDMVEALSAQSSSLVALGRHAEAAEAGRRAHALRPDSPDVANNCAVVLHQGGRPREAVELYRLAVAADPSHAGAWANLGVALQELFRFDDAVEAFEKAIAAKPDFHSAIVEAIKLRRHTCDWTRYAEDQERLLGLIGQSTDAVFMLLLMAFPSTAQQQLACAHQHMAHHNGTVARLAPYRPPVATARLKVGYLSADYRDHPVGRLLPEMLAQHDRRAFEVFGYALGPDDPGRTRRRIARACDHFVDLHSMSDRAAAERIHADAIDVLVDLTGPTTGARLPILTLRPAPVQVNFLGWPGSTGLDCIDYVIGDAFLTPGYRQQDYSEKIVQLPQCYQPSDPYRGSAVPRLTRADCGLPETGFVFCSFNNTLKLTPDLFDLWLRLLRQTEGSVLWLYCKTPRTMSNLQGYAEARGISTDRIVFAPVATMDSYLARLRLADLFLDSHPYNAGATCNDALWMGLPVVTCAGDTYVSRMAGSLLRAAGLPELITDSPAAYEALALRLATEPALLAAVRSRLAAQGAPAPLFDMPSFTAHLEQALVHMRHRFWSGQPAEGFAITQQPA